MPAVRGPSLWRLVTRNRPTFVRAVLAAAAAGLVMEAFAQWSAKLWIYPYWTPWLYWLVVLPGFVFYWFSIVESYLAVKAVLDAAGLPDRRSARDRFGPVLRRVLGVLGGGVLVIAIWLYAGWYAARGGYVFAATVPTRSAPPFGYVLLAFLGVWFMAEWGLRRRGVPSLASGVLRGYWTPLAAVAGSTLLLSLVMETQNVANQFWSYPHVPGPGVTLLGVQVSVFATWPLQNIAFLLVSSLFVPASAHLVWNGRGEPGTGPIRQADMDGYQAGEATGDFAVSGTSS